MKRSSLSYTGIIVVLSSLLALMKADSIDGVGDSAGPEIQVWYGEDQVFGKYWTAQAWINVLGNVSDPDDVQAVSYSLNGGSEWPVSIGPDKKRLHAAGDFNIDIPSSLLDEGLNTLEIVAIDTFGNRSIREVTVEKSPTKDAAEAYMVVWKDIDHIQEAVQVVDGLWAIDEQGISTAVPGYDRALALGDMRWDNYEIRLPITVRNVLAVDSKVTGTGPSVGVVLRWKGHDSSVVEQPQSEWLPIGAAGWYSWEDGGRLNLAGDHGLDARDQSGFEMALGQTYILKMRVHRAFGEGGGRYYLKMWHQDEQEPEEWLLSGQDGPSCVQEGSILLVAHYVDVTFGDLTVSPSAPKVSDQALISPIVLDETLSSDPLSTSSEAVLESVSPSALITTQEEGLTCTFAAISDYGDNDPLQAPNAQAVANLIGSKNPDFIITMGDNSYKDHDIDDNIGQFFSDYIGNYQGSYGSGSSQNRFFPSLGNHDWDDGGGINAYLSYFTLPGSGISSTRTSGNERYYDFIHGPVHFFAIDSAPNEPHGRTATSTQAQWLQTRLANSTSPWKVVFFHYPPYSAGVFHGDTPELQWPFEAWGASVVISGHDHLMNHVIKNGFSYFVSGAVRKIHLYDCSSSYSGNQFCNDTRLGALLVTATSSSMTFEFFRVGGTRIYSYVLNAASGTAPNITSHPSNATVAVGQTASFSVSATGTSPLSYRWQLRTSSSGSWSNISGATSPSYTTPATLSTHNGRQYRCRVSNSFGTVNSSPATLTVQVPPSITSHPSNASVPVGQTASFSVSATGTSPLSYQWQLRSSSSGSWSNVSGANNASYTTPATQSSHNGRQYRCRVTNSLGNAFSNVATLTVGTPPSINSHPSNQSVNEGQTATFQITASGSTPLTYQWQRQNPGSTSWANVGSNSSSYTTPAALLSHDGREYRCRVSNAFGGPMNSNQATLTVIPLPQAPTVTQHPVDTTVTVGLSATFSVQATGTAPLAYQWQRSVDDGQSWQDIGGAVGASYTTPATVLGADGERYRCRVTNGQGSDTSQAAVLRITSRVTSGQIALYVFDEGTGSVVNDVSGFGQPLDLMVSNLGAVQWMNGGGLAIQSPTVIQSSVNATKIVDACEASNEVTLEAWVTPANTLQGGPARIATVSSGTSARNITLGQDGNLYEVRLRTSSAQGGGPFLKTSQGTVDTTLTHLVFTRDQNGNETVYKNNVVMSTQTKGGDLSPSWSYYDLALANEVAPNDRDWLGEMFLVAFYDKALSPAEVLQNYAAGPVFNAPPQAPSVTDDPDSVSVQEGQSAFFSVVASGTPTLVYQWERRDSASDPWVNVGGNSASYTTGSTVPGDHGAQFRCTVTNNQGSDTSAVATLTVTPPPAPTITDHPAHTTVELGETASFTVQATGVGTLSYQWQRRNSPVDSWFNVGLNNNSYTTSATVAGDQGAQFRCLVSNNGGDTPSDPATLSVNLPSPPTVDSGPSDVTVPESSVATFSVSVSGTPPFTYQWQRRDSASGPWFNVGTSSSSYATLPTTVADDNGAEFQCMVSNTLGSDTGGPALLTVTEGSPRVTDCLVAFYSFDEGSGATVRDTSGFGAPLDLAIDDLGSVAWDTGSLIINNPTPIVSSGSASKVIDAIKASNAFTFEVWVKPDSVSLSQALRLVTLSQNGSSRNAALNQVKKKLQARTRHTGTDTKGQPYYTTSGVLTTELTHIVFSRDSNGKERYSINGVPLAGRTVAGNLSQWSSQYLLGLGGEVTGGYGMRGTFHLAAVYCKALSEQEVTQNFDAGPNGSTPPPIPVPQCELTPSFSSVESGNNHTFTSTVTLEGQPVAGVLVSFLVDAGPNNGKDRDRYYGCERRSLVYVCRRPGAGYRRD